MSEVRDFGALQYISAEAVGQPGQRRFRLLVLNEDTGSGALWLEKEQLSALGDALETVLKDGNYRRQRVPADDLSPAPAFPRDPDIEMRVVQLSMGVNQPVQRVVLIMGDSADPDGPDALNVQFEFDYRRAYELRQQIAEVVAAGRPKCPLCTAPMDPDGHVCVRSNGHHPH
jgi:uncharacterized repeat protein (TIGR03847 family)